MKITRNKLFLGLLIVGGISNLFILLGVDYLFLRPIFGLFFLTVLPGMLLTAAAKIHKVGFWEYSVYAVSLGVAFSMFAGLAINLILPLFHFTNHPLSLIPLLIGFNCLLAALGFIAYKRSRDISFSIKTRLNNFNRLFFAIPAVFPVLSALGAIVLNNGGPNYLTMILLAVIGLYVISAIFLRNRLNENVFPWAILLIGISLLLMFSMRSWHVSGWDINQELEMFKITDTLDFWSPTSIRDAYNACLSLTILPVMFARFTGIGDEYVFKLLYQLIFGFVPVAMYCIYRTYASKAVSFLAAFFFVSQFFFVQQMPALARQEIAFLFFALILLVLFEKKLPQKTKNALFIFFGFSMTVSHYSTTYVAIGLFAAAYLFSRICGPLANTRPAEAFFKFLKSNNKNSRRDFQNNIKFAPLLILIFLTFFWGMVATNSASDLFKALGNTAGSMKQMFSSDLKSWEIQESLAVFAAPNDNTAENIAKYNADEIKKHYALSSPSDRYENSANEKLTPISSLTVKPNNNFPFIGALLVVLALIKFLAKLLAIVGLGYILIRGPRNNQFNPTYLILCALGVGAILAMYILPVISQEYNLSRLYMQILILISLPTIYGGLLLTKFFGEKTRLSLLAGFFCLNFLYMLGFFNQIFGGPAYIFLNNFGDDYDRFYAHQVEVNSAEWLASNRSGQTPIFADFLSSLRLKSFAFINNTDTAILPSVMTKDSYIYLSYANVVQGRADALYNKNVALTYSYPIEFLKENKNMIYNNGGSQIFR